MVVIGLGVSVCLMSILFKRSGHALAGSISVVARGLLYELRRSKQRGSDARCSQCLCAMPGRGPGGCDGARHWAIICCHSIMLICLSRPDVFSRATVEEAPL